MARELAKSKTAKAPKEYDKLTAFGKAWRRSWAGLPILELLRTSPGHGAEVYVRPRSLWFANDVAYFESVERPSSEDGDEGESVRCVLERLVRAVEERHSEGRDEGASVRCVLERLGACARL